MYKWYPVTRVSHSSLNLLSMCPQKWFWSYVMKVKSPPGGATLVGSVGHATLEYMGTQFIDTGDWPGDEEMVGAYHLNWEKEWDKVKDLGISWGTEAQATMQQQGLELCNLYMRNPFVPESVELELKRDITDLFDTQHVKGFLGYLDLIDINGSVVDHKFSTRKKFSNEVHTDLQPYAYAFLLDEEIDFCFNELLRPKTSAKDPFKLRNERQWTHKNTQDIMWYQEQFMPGLVAKIDDVMTRIYDVHGNDSTWMEDTEYVQRLARDFPAIPNWSCANFCTYRREGMCSLRIQDHKRS